MESDCGGDALETLKDDSSSEAFAYLDQTRFTAEKYKVEIRNLPKYYGMPELKKLLSKKLKLDVTKVKRPHPGAPWVYICCRSEEARETAIKVVSGFKWKGNELRAAAAKAVPDPYIVNKKTNNEHFRNRNLIEELSDATIPLWKTPYNDQLEHKMKTAQSLLKKLGYELKGQNSALRNWLKNQMDRYNGLPCELEPIRYKPTSLSDDGYRNKCEFSIGINEETKLKTIGMRTGSYAQGSMCVVSPYELLHVSKMMKKAVALSEEFIRSSNLDVYNQATHEGHWKSLTARYSSRTNELMLMFIIEPGPLTESDLNQVEANLRDFFSKSLEIQLYSLILAVSAPNRNPPSIRLVLGQPYIHEQVCDLSLRISALAFFQVNTPVAEMMFKAISEIGDLNEETALVDVCCGAGTIGLCLAKSCGQVLGLEICEKAIEDAKLNAKENNITNADFFAGKAEELLSAVVHRSRKPRILAVVDPPRAGLGRNAISQLRRTEKIKQLIYISCQPQLALKNFVDLGRSTSKQYPGEPFVPTKCIPFDMFPHTPGVELVFLFQRLSTIETVNLNSV